MLDPVAADRRALVDLLPQFLTGALRGWQGLAPFLASAGLERPAFFLLRALVQERDAVDGMTQEEMHADLFNPYSTFRPILDALPALVAAGCVIHAGNQYTVTENGRALFAQTERARNAYLASFMPVPPADLTRLDRELMTIAHCLRGAPEPAQKPHQTRAWRVMPPADATPMARLYGAVYALWMARDDSHSAAWRAAGFDAPAFDLLSRVWSSEAATIPALIEVVREFQRPVDVERGIVALVARGYLTRTGDLLALTPRGNEIREQIETETDRIYFAPWPSITRVAVAWLRMILRATIAGLP